MSLTKGDILSQIQLTSSIILGLEEFQICFRKTITQSRRSPPHDTVSRTALATRQLGILINTSLKINYFKYLTDLV